MYDIYEGKSERQQHMPSEVIDRVHTIARKAPEDLIFGDRNNNPLSDTIPFVDIGPWSNDDDSATPPDEDSDTGSAYIPSDADDDDDSDSGSSGPDNEANASDIAGVSESEEEEK